MIISTSICEQQFQTGQLGRLVTKYTVSSNHNVSVLVRDSSKLHHALGSKIKKRLRGKFVGDCAAADSGQVLKDACAGQYCVIECLGNAQRPAALKALIAAAAEAKCESFVALGGTPALLMPDGQPVGPCMATQRMADLHLHTLSLLQASALPGWCQVCPSRLFASITGDPSGKFKLCPNVVDMNVYALNAELAYEDVATAMVNLVDVQENGWHGTQVAFHLVYVPVTRMAED